MPDQQNDMQLALRPDGLSAAPVRDPRVDPRPGDLLRKPGEFHGCGMSDFPIERRVYQWTGSRVFHSRGFCELKTWRRWAKNAEVLHVSTEGQAQPAGCRARKQLCFGGDREGAVG